MNITKTTSYKIGFFVAFYESAEGGMYYDTFGDKTVYTLQEAIELLELAQLSQKDREWLIVCDVTKTVK